MKSFKNFFEMELPSDPDEYLKLWRGRIKKPKLPSGPAESGYSIPKLWRGTTGKPMMVGNVAKEKANLAALNKVSYTIDALFEYCIFPFKNIINNNQEYKDKFSGVYSSFVNLNKTCQLVKIKATPLWTNLINDAEKSDKANQVKNQAKKPWFNSWFKKNPETMIAKKEIGKATQIDPSRRDYSSEQDNLPRYLTKFNFSGNATPTIHYGFNKLKEMLFAIDLQKGYSGTPDYMSPEAARGDDTDGCFMEDFRELLSALYSDTFDQVRQMAKSLGLAWDNFVKEWEEFANLFPKRPKTIIPQRPITIDPNAKTAVNRPPRPANPDPTVV